MLPYFIHGQQHRCTWQVGCSPPVCQGMGAFSGHGIYSPRTIRRREGNLWRTCPLAACTVVFISFINHSWEQRALSVKISFTVMRHTHTFWLLSPLRHPELLENKALRARAGLSQRTVSSVCGSRWIRSIFSRLCRRWAGMQLPAMCPRHLVNIWGWSWEEPCLYLSVPSPWRVFQVTVTKAKWSEAEYWSLIPHRGRGRCLCPHLLCPPIPAAVPVVRPVKNPDTSGTSGCICTRKQHGQGTSAGSGPWLSILLHFEHAEWHDFGPCQLAPSQATDRESVSQGWSTLF